MASVCGTVVTSAPGVGPTAGDLLQVELAVEGSEETTEARVPLTVTSSTGYASDGLASVGPGSRPLAVEMAISPPDYERLLDVTVTVDPYGDIVESDESNNARLVTIELPVRSAGYLEVACDAS